MSNLKLSPLQFEKLKQRVNWSIVDIFQNQAKQIRERSPVISICENMNGYRAQNKIKISKEKVTSIEKRRQIKNESKNNYQQRINNMSQYLQFTLNPFTYNLDSIPTCRKKIEQNPVSIFQGIKRSKQKNRIENILLRLDKVSNHFQKRAIVPRKPPHFLRYEPFDKSDQKQFSVKYDISKDILFLDSLLVYQKPDFILFTKKKLNLFQFSKNQHHKDFRNRKQILQSNYFCRKSVVSTTQPAQQFLLHLSFIGRQLASNHTSEISNQYLITQNHIFANLDKLGFHELMFISCGQLDWKVLDKFLSGFTNLGDDNIQLISDYHKRINSENWEKEKNGHNTSTLNNNLQGYEQIQKNGYLNFDFTTKQKGQLEYSVEQKQQLRRITQIQLMVKAYNIADIRLLQEIQRVKTEAAIKITTKKQEKQISTNQKIILKKKQKSRQERIKNQIAAQAFKNNKSVDKQILPKRRNKGSNYSVSIQSKSPPAKKRNKSLPSSQYKKIQTKQKSPKKIIKSNRTKN